MFKTKNLINDSLKIYDIKAIHIMQTAYMILIIAITLNFFVAWKYGSINAKNTPSKNVLITTKQNSNLLSKLQKMPPKHTNIAKRIAFVKNNEIFNLTSL